MTHGAAVTPEFAELADEYDILGELGRGGSAVVFRARDQTLGREVAIKVVYARPASPDDDGVARLAREARTVAQLQHPNIVTVYAVRRLRGGGLALVMPLVPGRTLKQIVQHDGPLPPDRCERILRDVAGALAYAHGRGIIHRDVKPENIFLDEDTGRALLADFGIARTEEHESLTMTGTAIGTPFYMSPEQIDNAPLDGRSDLYSLGLVAWEMLTGRRPWDGESLYNVIYKQKHETLPPIEALRPGVPPRLQYIVERMLHKQPAERWAGADGMLAQLSHTVLPRDYARWQATLRKRVTRYQSAERARKTQPPPRPADGGTPTGAIASATMRLLRGAGLLRAADGSGDALANTMAVGVPPDLRAPTPATAPADDAAETTTIAAPAPRAGEPAAPPRFAPTWSAARQGRRPRIGVWLAGLLVVVAASAAVAERDRLVALLAASPIGPAFVTSEAAAADGPVVRDPDAAAGTGVDGGGASPAVPPPPLANDALVPIGRGTESIVAGGRHSCVVAAGATIHCWGANERGQLGNGTFGRRTLPTTVAAELAFVQVAAGTTHTCGVTRLDDVYCWGFNARGQLGDATIVRREAPVRIAGPGAYAAVAAGTSHSCALTRGGEARCWGANERGQLGDGTRTRRSQPAAVRLGAALSFTAVAAGAAHSCAIAADGTAYCWGANEAGQLGDGAREDRFTPTLVAGGHRFAAIATGQAHTCAVTRAGETFCWGRNNFGQLGTGTPVITPTPTRVRLTVPVADVAVGSLHSCALGTDGRAHCWGRNGYGQLGDGTVADRAAPVRVRLDEPALELTANGSHACAVGASGTVRCWGYNGEGQLGDSTLANRALPTPVRLGLLTAARTFVPPAGAPAQAR